MTSADGIRRDERRRPATRVAAFTGLGESCLNMKKGHDIYLVNAFNDRGFRSRKFVAQHQVIC
jgi:hypothetical protein